MNRYAVKKLFAYAVGYAAIVISLVESRCSVVSQFKANSNLKRLMAMCIILTHG